MAKKNKFFLDSDTWPSFLTEYSKADDRSCAIMLAAYLDQCLEMLLHQSFIDTKIAENLLRESMPLGSFSARIKIARALNLISERLYHDIEFVRKIRNYFAHHFESARFELEPVRSWCDELEIPKTLKYQTGETIYDSVQGNSRSIYMITAGIMATTMESSSQQRSKHLNSLLEELSQFSKDFDGQT